MDRSYIDLSIHLSQRRQWHPTPLLLPGKSHGWRSLVGCSPWGREGLDTTEWLHFHFSLSCIGEGNGNPLQCSCLENPRDRRAWWATVYGVAQSRTRLKGLSNSSSSIHLSRYIWAGYIQSIGSQRVGHDWSDLTHTHTHIYRSIVDLQYCLNFWYIARWLSYTYIYSFTPSFQLWLITG